MTVTRRTLQRSLAVLWLLDAALQFQPFMFSKAFGRTTLAPVGIGQPGIVATPVHFAVDIVVAHPVLTNAIFATVQLVLALGLLWRRSVRWALVGSIGWALSVWWVGEGLGGLTTGETLLTGAPGAALLYVAVAALAFPDREGESAIAPPRAAYVVWAALWTAGAGLQIAAGNLSGQAFAAMFRDAASSDGNWLSGAASRLGHLHFSSGFVAALVAVEVLVAMWALVPGRTRQISAVIGSGIAVAAWLLVQGLGELASGQATDPNSGPLIVLLGLAVLGATRAQPTTAKDAISLRPMVQLKSGRDSRPRLSS